jgi:hypothetical protein
MWDTKKTKIKNEQNNENVTKKYFLSHDLIIINYLFLKLFKNCLP